MNSVPPTCREIGVKQAVETGAGHVNVAIDFSAAQKHVALENRAIAQVQIAFGTQTLSGEVALYPRPVE
jgi:hypothetical protein